VTAMNTPACCYQKQMIGSRLQCTRICPSVYITDGGCTLWLRWTAVPCSYA